MNRDSAEHFCVFVAAAASVALQIMRNTRHFISFFVAPSEEIKYGRGAELSSFLVDPLCCDRKWIPRTDLTALRDEFESGEGGRGEGYVTDARPAAACNRGCLQRGAAACGGVCLKLDTG